MSLVPAAFEAFFATLESNSNSVGCSAANVTFWIGLSAGVDSTVLLHAAAQWVINSKRQEQVKIKALHVHHGLSRNADEWAQQAQGLCAEISLSHGLDIECLVERVQLNETRDGIEQAARKARYDVFEKYCQDGDVLLQGHHLDDQFETFFMRALRGSGLTGLAGIPAQRPLSRVNQCRILRPLLTLEKADIVAYAKKHQLVWVEDESNQDSQFDRNWWRNELLPQIWQRYPEQKQALSRTIDNIAHEQGLLQQLIIERLADSADHSQARIHPALNNIPRFDLLLIRNLDQASAMSYLRAWLAQFVDILPSALQMKTIYTDMIQARPDAESRFCWAGMDLYRHRDDLFLLNQQKLSDGFEKIVSSNDWQERGLISPIGELTVNKSGSEMALKTGSYRLRAWQNGDTAKPYNRSTRKMKKWWQDYNVPSWARQYWPLIVDCETNEIAAIPGLFVCQGFETQQSAQLHNQIIERHYNYAWCFKRIL